VKSVDAKGAVINNHAAEGYLRASEFSRDRIEDPPRCSGKATR
jgi:hypothetical protein